MQGANGRDRVDPSPRDLHQNTCEKEKVSEEDRTTYLAPRGILRSSRSASTEGYGRIGRLIFVERRSRSDGWRETCIKPSDGAGRLRKNTIASRSSRDRGAIEPRSRLRWQEAGAESSPVDRQTIDEARAARSSLIAAQFSRDHGENRGMIVAKIMAIPPRN